MKIDWAFELGAALTVAGGATILVLIAGFIGTWRALGVPSAPMLRNE